jgi:catalase
MIEALTSAGALGKIVAPRLGYLKASDGGEFLIEFSLLTASSVLFDAVYVPGGERSVRALSAGIPTATDGADADPALVIGDNGQTARVVRQFIQAIAQHRNWTRQGKNRLVPSPGGELRGEEGPL